MHTNRHLLCPGQIYFASSCYGAEKLCVFEAEPQMGFLVWISQTLGPKPFTEGAWGAPSVEIFNPQVDAMLDNLL